MVQELAYKNLYAKYYCISYLSYRVCIGVAQQLHLQTVLVCHSSYTYRLCIGVPQQLQTVYWCATIVTDCVLVCHSSYTYRLCIEVPQQLQLYFGVPQQLQTVLVCHSRYRLYWCATVVPDCVLVCHSVSYCISCQFQNAFSHCWSELLTVPLYTGGPHCDCICFSHHSVLSHLC